MNKLESYIQNTLIKLTGYQLVKRETRSHIDCIQTIDALLKHHNPKIVCDIGSNNGFWSSVLFETLFDKFNDITFFEPQKKYQNQLQNLSFPNVKKRIFNIGLGNSSGNLTIKGGNACASFLDFNAEKKDFFVGNLTDENEEVKVETLNSVYNYNQIPIPDLIKIDVQGFEYEVLEGGSEVIPKAKFLVIELSMDDFYKTEKPMWKILKILDEYNFRLIDTGFQWRVNYDPNEKLVYIDGIFANRNYL